MDSMSMMEHATTLISVETPHSLNARKTVLWSITTPFLSVARLPMHASRTPVVPFSRLSVTLKVLDLSVSAPMISRQSTTHAAEIPALLIRVKVARLVTKLKAQF